MWHEHFPEFNHDPTRECLDGNSTGCTSTDDWWVVHPNEPPFASMLAATQQSELGLDHRFTTFKSEMKGAQEEGAAKAAS